MAADPEPDQAAVRRFDREDAVASADASRPELIYLLEVKRWMSRILLQASVRLIGEIPNLLWRSSVERPEVSRRVVDQIGVVLPAA